LQKYGNGGGKGRKHEDVMDVVGFFSIDTVQETGVVEEETNVMLSPDVEGFGNIGRIYEKLGVLP
jgi:hypothetical protein